MSLTLSLAGKRALVTGASGGLGEHFAKVMARQGARVALGARRVSSCERIVAEIKAEGGEAIAVALDVANGASARAAVGAVVEAFGGLDVLVNNAGIAHTAPLKTISEADWDAVLDTNLKGAFLVAQAAADAMRGTGGGSIVNIASILGIRIVGQLGAYCSSKAGLIQLTKVMALEWARDGIRVNALCPGYIETDINREFFQSEGGQAIIRRVPMRRLGHASDLDGPLLLLASEAGAYMTGTAIAVDGGHLVSSL